MGFFGMTYSSSQIKNLGVEDAAIACASYSGIRVGVNLGTITDCYSTGSVLGQSDSDNVYYLGGLVGYNYGDGTLTDSCATGSASSPRPSVSPSSADPTSRAGPSSVTG